MTETGNALATAAAVAAAAAADNYDDDDDGLMVSEYMHGCDGSANHNLMVSILEPPTSESHQRVRGRAAGIRQNVVGRNRLDANGCGMAFVRAEKRAFGLSRVSLLSHEQGLCPT